MMQLVRHIIEAIMKFSISKMSSGWRATRLAVCSVLAGAALTLTGCSAFAPGPYGLVYEERQPQDYNYSQPATGNWGAPGGMTTGSNTSDAFYNYLGQMGYYPVDGKGTFVNQATGRMIRCDYKYNLSGKDSVVCNGARGEHFKIQRNPWRGGEVTLTPN